MGGRTFNQKFELVLLAKIINELFLENLGWDGEIK
jgi:hypothetical protein